MRSSDFPATHEDENVTDNFILIDSFEAVAVDDNSIDTVFIQMSFINIQLLSISEEATCFYHENIVYLC